MLPAGGLTHLVLVLALVRELPAAGAAQRGGGTVACVWDSISGGPSDDIPSPSAASPGGLGGCRLRCSSRRGQGFSLPLCVLSPLSSFGFRVFCLTGRHDLDIVPSVVLTQPSSIHPFRVFSIFPREPAGRDPQLEPSGFLQRALAFQHTVPTYRAAAIRRVWGHRRARQSWSCCYRAGE